jgi:RES domain-containing protein
MAYASPTLSLAALEMFVNLKLDEVPDDLVAIPATIPEELAVEQWEISSLPANWRDFSPPQILRKLGSEWIRSRRSVILSVPSVVIPEEFNVLLNPAHPDFDSLEIGPPRRFQFDPRMWKR